MTGEQTSGPEPQKTSKDAKTSLATTGAETREAATREAPTTLAIQVNGEPRRCGAGLTLVQVLEGLGYRPQLVVVEFNGEILPRQRWAAQTVVESDVLEVVTIVGGGS